MEKLNKKEKQNALNEIRILGVNYFFSRIYIILWHKASIKHPNIVGFKECFIEEK